jgi:hypothetical protein
MPSLFDRSNLAPVVNYIMWRLTWPVMNGPRLDLGEALPEGIYGRRWQENIDTKDELAKMFLDAVPALNAEHFVLTRARLGERMDDDWLTGTVEPLDAKVTVGGRKDWVDAALQSRDAFASGLRSIGLPDDEVERTVSLRDDTEAQLRAIELDIESHRPPGASFAVDPVPPELYARRRSLWRRFADYFSDREIRVLETTETEMRVPLFVLAGADVAGCTAKFDQQEMRTRPLSWSMTVFGSGLGGSRELKASAAASFTAAAGETKVVFQPLLLTVQRVVVLLDGRQVGGGVQVDSAGVRTDASPGLLLLSSQARPPTGPSVQRFPLAGDTTGALASYKWVYSRTSKMNLSVGLDAFHTTLSLTVGTELTTQVTLQYELRGGHDYVLLRVGEGDGLLWAPTEPPPASSA